MNGASHAGSPRTGSVSQEAILRLLQGVENDLFAVFSARRMWGETLGIIRSNENIPLRGVVAGWIGRMYAHYVLMGLRRHLSNNEGDVSLRRFLELVYENPQLFTREAFVARMGYSDQADIAFANELFDKWGPNGAAHLDPEVVRADIVSLSNAAERACDYATKTVAHLDREYAYPEGIVDIDKISWNDIDAGMDQIEALVLKYYPLVAGKGLAYLTPEPVLGWKRAFTVPWSPDRRREKSA